MKVSKPTMIAAIAYAVLAIVILSPLNIGEYDLRMQETRKFDLGYRLVLLLVLLVPIGLSLYSIDCMVRGRCVVWSYVNAVAICAWVVLFLAASVIASR